MLDALSSDLKKICYCWIKLLLWLDIIIVIADAAEWFTLQLESPFVGEHNLHNRSFCAWLPNENQCWTIFYQWTQLSRLLKKRVTETREEPHTIYLGCTQI